jgi:hypothetical protein
VSFTANTDGTYNMNIISGGIGVSGSGTVTQTFLIPANFNVSGTQLGASQPALGNSGRPPTYVQTPTGQWVPSYWSMVPRDILSNYGPLSDASNLPTPQYGYGSDRQPIYNDSGQKSYWSTVPDDVLQNYGPLSEASLLPTPTGTPAPVSNQASNPTDQPGDPGPRQSSDTSAARQASNQSNAQQADGQEKDQPPAGQSQQTADNSPSEPDQPKGKPFTPGSTDDPNCVAGCYDPKLLNDIGIQPQYADGTKAPPPEVQPSPVSQLSLDDLNQNRALLASQLRQQQQAYGNSLDDGRIEPVLGKDIGFIGSAGACFGKCAGIVVSLGGTSGLTVYSIDPAEGVGTPPTKVAELFSLQVTHNAQGVASGPSLTRNGVTVNDDGIAWPIIPSVGTAYTVNRPIFNIQP